MERAVLHPLNTNICMCDEADAKSKARNGFDGAPSVTAELHIVE
jgi:hypothetical protein